MAAYSKLDKEIFDEFGEQKQILKEIASNVKKVINNPDFIKLNIISAEEAHYSAKEGKILYQLHRYKERNATLVNKKKKQYFKRHGNLACELCQFDFYAVYGEVGKGFAECHHKVPLYSLNTETTTHLDDLMIICSNCHRMVHRGWSLD
ncbi:HNH endonuclease [Pedobacter sp. KBW01]|uniref:HNH endonuclease n=1 Tax=Pedobacter sp. KBW01 TaxID=2153364 RepID=UPI0018F6DA61|nr:HNH endonuclease [Pedobacter sp. KBW01]